MKTIHDFALPEDLQNKLRKAKKLEWITVIYLCTVVVLMYLVMGSSQAMKSAWLEDVLSLVPSIAFLIATKINSKKPNKKFPYGYHRVFSISFMAGAVALLGMGLFLVFDSSMSLIKAEHPSIGNKFILGHDIWTGWIMIVVLLYSSVPAMFLGFKKLPIAEKLHNKILYTDASAQKADYSTSLAAILGIIGIANGLWWADAAAALFISFSVLKDGYTHLKTSILDLMDREPVTIKKQKRDPVLDNISQTVDSWPWVKSSKVRFREHGQVFFGEIYVVPHEVDLQKMEDGYHLLRKRHWKIHDFSIVPVSKLPDW